MEIRVFDKQRAFEIMSNSKKDEYQLDGDEWRQKKVISSFWPAHTGRSIELPSPFLQADLYTFVSDVNYYLNVDLYARYPAAFRNISDELEIEFKKRNLTFLPSEPNGAGHILDREGLVIASIIDSSKNQREIYLGSLGSYPRPKQNPVQFHKDLDQLEFITNTIIGRPKKSTYHANFLKQDATLYFNL